MKECNIKTINEITLKFFTLDKKLWKDHINYFLDYIEVEHKPQNLNDWKKATCEIQMDDYDEAILAKGLTIVKNMPFELGFDYLTKAKNIENIDLNKLSENEIFKIIYKEILVEALTISLAWIEKQ